MPEAQVADIKTARDSRLHFGRLNEAEHARRRLFADIPAGTAYETILQPTYWAHHVQVIKPMDLIEAFCEDGSWEALFRVMFVGKTEVKLSNVYFTRHDNTDQIASVNDIYEIVWKGPGAKFAVINKENKSVVKDRLYPRSEAIAYLRLHLGQMKG